jgi:acetyl-CoA carboxylase carboxyl transferase subunit beta
MNWLTKIKIFGDKIKRNLQKKFPTKEEIANSDWTSCCKGPILKKDLEDNLWICNSCGKHHRINCRQRFDIFFGKNRYEILETPVPLEDPLNWKDTKTYKERLVQARKKTGQNCAVMIAKGQINGIEVTAGAVNFEYIGGSFGAAEAEAFIYGAQNSLDNNTPYIFFASGGGQRMFESPIALAGMTRTTIAVNELKKKEIPYLVIFVDPCAGGITASFAMLGDIHFAEPGSLIAFAGKRVIQATVKEELSPDFQTAEFVEKHGFIDKVVSRKDLSNEIGKLLEILLKKNSDVNSELSNETSTNIEQPSKAAS